MKASRLHRRRPSFPRQSFSLFRRHYSRKRATYLQSGRKAKYYRILIKRLSAYILSRSNRDFPSGTPFLSEGHLSRNTFSSGKARIFLRTRQTNVNSRNLAREMYTLFSPSLFLSSASCLLTKVLYFTSGASCFPSAPAALRSFMTF